MGNKIRYHINGTKLDFLGKKALAEYLGCSVANINNAEKRWCTKKGNVSFWVKSQRVKRIERIKYIDKKENQ